MNAAILCIGDELLIGQVVNTNASWLGEQLVGTGVDVVAVSTIGDARERIVHEIERLVGLADLVIITGGLGPTEDDLTRDAICDLLECDMTIDAAQLERIERRFADRGYALNERSRQQARVPVAARVLPNDYGSAPGLDFRYRSARVVALPGVPSELKGIMSDHVLPDLAANAGAIAQTTLLVFGPTESALADMLVDATTHVGGGVSLAYLPSTGGIRLRIMRTGDDDETLRRFELLLDGIRQRVASWLVSDDGALLPEATGRALRESGLSLVTAESCTGGMIGEMITDVAGSSEYYRGGVVAYSNALKSSMLDVDASLIERHGAVSEEVALAMAEGALRRLGGDIAVSVTGIAGPGGGSAQKPVGTVWIGVASSAGSHARRYALGAERSIVRQRAAFLALDMVRREALRI